MNHRLQVIVQAAGALAIVAFLFPPWINKYGGEVKWAPLWNPVRDRFEYGWNFYGKAIAWDRLLIELAIIAMASFLAYTFLKRENS